MDGYSLDTGQIGEQLKILKEKTIERLANRLEDCLDDEDTKQNIAIYKYTLERGILDGHEGRYAVFHKGSIFGATFASENAFLNDELSQCNESYTLYQIPGIPTEYSSTAYHRAEIQLKNTGASFSSLDVAVTFESDQLQLQSTTFQYEIDTGASHTTCPVYIDGTKSPLSCKALDRNDGEVEVELKWKVLAFWGRLHLGCHKNSDETLADGTTRYVEKLLFRKGQLRARVGNCAPVEIQYLTFQKEHVQLKILPKNLQDATHHPPTLKIPMLLGRDLLFKQFSMFCTKQINKEPKVHLFNRPDITPPSSPKH